MHTVLQLKKKSGCTLTTITILLETEYESLSLPLSRRQYLYVLVRSSCTNSDNIRPFRALLGLNLELDSYVDATERSPDLGPAQKDVMSDFRECLVSSLKIMMQRS